ncbi:putative glycolipid-binding domain-containing protein [Halorarum salinum]|uniref:Putative glycolipid-binding domain-containing protein n=1 Tax=Halorarum salinum TaxID=2743089 RepID=A0A7D5QAB8_9EURY|nr:putative glycolipid-binding domain-containing protein [Halobaculum salinum]QLG60820.1 putative glycolipid-binding domain-containing protein [Halobaculum salinum]
MFRDVYWKRIDGTGGEHLRLIEDSSGVSAQSVVVGVVDGSPVRVHYEIELDRQYRVQRVDVTTPGRGPDSLTLRADGEGNWTDGRGEELPALDGCIDVDVSATPFSNTLPIRRAGLERDEPTELSVVYVRVPELSVEVATQRYTRLDPADGDGGKYRYESVSSGFTAELTVDSDGLVVEYPGLFDRVPLP